MLEGKKKLNARSKKKFLQTFKRNDYGFMLALKVELIQMEKVVMAG